MSFSLSYPFVSLQPTVLMSLLLSETSRQTKEKVAFFLLCVCPLGLGLDTTLYQLLPLLFVILFLRSWLELRLSLMLTKDRERVVQLLQDSHREDEALALVSKDGSKSFGRVAFLHSAAKKKSLAGEKQSTLELLELAVDAIPEFEPKDCDPNQVMACAKALSDLGSWLQEARNKENNERIESLLRRGIELGKSSVGEEDARVTLWLMNFGIFLQQETEKLQEALDLFEQVLQIRKQVLGEQDPLVAEWMVNMAYLLHERSDPSKRTRILQLVDDALELRRKIYGEEHEMVASSMGDCAMMKLLTMQGEDMNEMVQAFQMGKDSVAMLERTLGSEHPKAIQARKNWT